MANQAEKLKKLTDLVAQHAPQEGVNLTSSPNIAAFKISTTQAKGPTVDVPALVIVGQGKKNCYVGDRVYEYCPGKALIMFYPMAVEIEFVEASPDKPFLAACVGIDLGRLANVLVRLERIDGGAAIAPSPDPSAVFSAPLSDNLLDPMIRFWESLADPVDAAFMGESIVDEIYYRVLRGERGRELRTLLQQRGQIQGISKAVEYIHRNLDKPVSVEQLAEMVFMSRTRFYKTFRDVMHLTPLQYAKSVKLDRAHTLIQEGKKASEAGYLVGYNCPSQFSREYKRHFGYAPSAT